MIRFGLMSLGLFGVLLDAWGMRTTHARTALFGIGCVTLEFAIAGGILLYLRSYLYGFAFSMVAVYLIVAMLRPARKKI